MKTFTFRYESDFRKSSHDAIARAIKYGKGKIHQDEIVCRSMEDMMKIMTKSRFQVFTTIVEKTPQSITQLAEYLDKDLGNVFRDVKILESLGLIKLKRVKDMHREKLLPVALYKRIIFECEPERSKIAI